MVKTLKCPYCKFAESKVLESRALNFGEKIRRRRECQRCSKRFTTYEVVEKLPLAVVKRDGSRECFDRQKLFNGILKSCGKRPISLNQIEQIVDDIENHAENNLEKEIPSISIGEMVMESLKKADEVAYVRFASVYRQFKDINTFMEELKKMLE